MSKGDIAKELFKNGCNCSQAVFCAFCDKTGIEKENALRLAAGFGGGFGRMREVCGAVSGMTMVLSYCLASTDPNNSGEKAELYKIIQQAIAEFKTENGSYICRELLGLNGEKRTHVPEERTQDYYKKRPCAELCRIAADIAEKYVTNLK